MATKLVIVESPAKARTIGSYLGDDYEVEASIGHIRDLANKSSGLPEDKRKEWWAQYAVDVDHGFEPFYEVPPEKLAQVSKLRAALKGKQELILATDEDREGEAISWHLLQALKPGKGVAVKRIAFHEITREAIREALANPRTVDLDLVEAQETRRILDRLYGYSISPVLWKKVMPRLSAGRVQSPAVKLIVEREMARRDFKPAVYWGLKARYSSPGAKEGGDEFSADLRRIDGVRLATGADFEDTTGALKKPGGVRLLDGPAAGELGRAAQTARPHTLVSLKTREAFEKPAPPFMTTTLQQDANRKLGFGAERTMRAAQGLYEGVEIAGERVGLITYMRTDSLSLSEDAVKAMRTYIEAKYPGSLPEKPVKYASKVKNAQEAHEAIRPTDVNRTPEAMARYLSEDQRKVYTLVWQRAVASQMKPARVLRTEAEIEVALGHALGDRLVFGATGRQILDPGYLAVYSVGVDDGEEEGEGRLPRLTEGQTVVPVEPNGFDARESTTKAPPRYNDATLIKALEEKGIGRPSTYASIISVIQDRGYVRKEGKALVPTFKACMTMDVLETGFAELVDLGFTARMDEALDEIAGGRSDSKDYLQEFFFGSEGHMGLHPLVEERKEDIPFPVFSVGDNPETGEAMIVRNSRDGGAFLQTGDPAEKRWANVPDDIAPADLTVERAMELYAQKRNAPASESVGLHPETGRNLLLKFRENYYLEVERTPEEIEAKVKPTWVSVPPGVDPRELAPDDLDFLCSLPLAIGEHPETHEPIVFRIGKFGAFLEAGTERRTVEDWREGRTMDVARAAEILRAPKTGMRQARAAAGPIQEFGVLEGAAGNVRVLAGRFGPYVTDGETNATLPKGTDPATVDAETANRILTARRESGPRPAPLGKGKGKAPARKAAPKTAAKPAAKGAAPKTTRAKKA